MKNDFLNILNGSAVKAARVLLGAYLCRSINGKIYKLLITETEAYEGLHDRASHAYSSRLGRTRQTARNAPMWGSAGTIYVYFTYGMHYMLNIVTGKPGHPGAVLIRSVAGISGPGRLTKKLKIDKKLNGKMLGRDSGLWIEEGKIKKKIKIARTPRKGIAAAGPVWSQKLYRFVLLE